MSKTQRSDKTMGLPGTTYLSSLTIRIIKLLMLATRNSPLFSLHPLRRIRWGLYRYIFKAPQLYVDEGVVIAVAHRHSGAGFKCLGRANIGRHAYIDCSGGVEIGDGVAISEGARLFTHNHCVHGVHRDWQYNPIEFSSLKVQRYCWIGAGATILASVTEIGEGSIVAAGSVLTKNTEPYAIYGGNPARKIGMRRLDGGREL